MAWYWRLPFLDNQIAIENSFFKRRKGKHLNILRGEHYKQDDFPNELQILTKHKTLPCFIRVTGDVLVVCQGFRDAVEDLEPGVHRFFPVVLRMRSGEPAERRYFILNIHQQFDAILLRHSDWDWRWSGGKKMYPNEERKFLPPMGTRLGLSRPAIAGRHLWHSMHMALFFSFVSDELYERMQACRPLGLDIHYCEEYDEPWVMEENVDLGDEGAAMTRPRF